MEGERPVPVEPDGASSGPRVPVRLEEALAALAMALICLISLANVVVRYLTSVSFAFTEEYSVFLLVFMTFVGASAAFATNDHIRIAWLLERLPPRLALAAELLTLVVTTLLFALVVWFGAQVAFDEWYWGETSPGLGHPSWIYSIWLPILALAILLRVAGRGWRELRRGPRARR